MRLRVAAGIAFVVLILGACLSIRPMVLDASAELDVPVMVEGDFWEYETTFISEGLNFEGTTRFEMKNIEDVTVGSTTHSAYKITLDGDGTFSGYDQGAYLSGTWTVTGLGYYDTSSYELVKIVENGDIDGSWQLSGMSGTFDQSTHNTTTYELVSSTWNLPIKAGDSGTVRRKAVSSSAIHYESPGSPDIDISEDSAYNETLNYSCTRTEEVTVPAGTFDTHLIKRTAEDGSFIDMWYSQEVGEAVKNEYYDENGTWFGTDLLVSFQYKGPAGSDSDDRLLIIVLIAIAIAVVLIALIIGLKMRKRPVPATVPVGEPAQANLAAGEGPPTPAERTESAMPAPAKQKGRESIQWVLAIRYASITAMAIAFLLVVFGISFLSVIDTEYEIIGYESEPSAQVSGGGWYLAGDPIYGKSSAYPYFMPGLVLVILGTAFLVIGYSLLTRNENKIRLRTVQGKPESKTASRPGARRNAGDRGSSSDYGSMTGNAKRQLFLACMGAIVVGVVLLIGSAAFWNAEMKKEFIETKFDLQTGEYTEIDHTTEYPLRDEGMILAIVGTLMISLAAVGTLVYATTRDGRRRMSEHIGNKVPAKHGSGPEEV